MNLVNYVSHLLTQYCLYAMLAVSLNIAVGYTGLISLCHAAFYGLGAYATGLLMVDMGWNFIPAMAAGVAMAGAGSLLVSVPPARLRLRKDAFVLATLAFQMVVFTGLYNWADLTRGSDGLARIPRPSAFGWVARTPPAQFVLAATVSVAVIGFASIMAASPFGRLLRLVRDDAIAAEAIGKRSARVRVAGFALAAMMAAIPGALFAGFSGFIQPTSFDVGQAFFLLAVVVIGGSGNRAGPLIGAAVMTAVPELLRFLPMPSAAAAGLQQIAYGLLLIVLVLVRPSGLWGEYDFSK